MNIRASILFFVTATVAHACDSCAIYSASGSKPGFNLGAFEQFTHFGTVQDDGHGVANPARQSEDSSITQFILGYQFNDDVGMQVNVPYIYRAFRRPEGLAIDKGTESGLGDLTLLGNVRVFQRLKKHSSVLITLLAGVKFPTGDSRRLKEELNETPPPPGVPASGIHGHDLALGSGSYDGIVGGAAYARWNRLFATANVQYAIRSEGDFDYRYADALTWSGGPGMYLWLEDEGTLRLQLNISGEHKGLDAFQGAKADDTGITAVYLGPEIAFTWQDRLTATVGVDLPVVQDNTALQLVPDYRVRAAVTWRF